MFKHILETSQKFKSNHNVFFRYSKQNMPYIGFIIDTKFGNAVLRNRFKNQARYLYRNFFNLHSYGIIVRPLSEQLDFEDLKKAFKELNNNI